jgi:serine/threonine protein kinase
MAWSIPSTPPEFSLEDVYEVSSTERTGLCPRMAPVDDASLRSLRVGVVWAEVYCNPSYDQEAPPAYLQEPRKMIDLRVKQMGSIKKKGIPLDDSQKFFLAEVINAVFHRCSPERIWRFKKQRGCEGRCSFVVDPANRLCFILSDEITRGVGKKLRDAITLPFDPSASSFLSAAKVSLTKREGPSGREKVDVWLSQEMVSAFDTEVQMISKYHESFPDSYGTFEHQSHPLWYRSLRKITRLEAKMSDGCRLCFENLNGYEQLEFASKFLSALARLYPQLHGDVKSSNVLYRCSGGDVEVKLIDLGLTACPQKGTLSYIMEEGFYGSVFCTAPEVIGQDPGDVNWYKAEDWAVGCVLYRWVIGQEVPWGKLLENYRSGGQGLKGFDAVSMQMHVRTALEPLQKMADTGSRSSKAVIARLCLDFLDFDSESRLSVRDAGQRLLDYARYGVSPLRREADEQMVFGRGADPASLAMSAAPLGGDFSLSPMGSGLRPSSQ